MAALCETNLCRRKYLLNYFDEAAPDYCGNCDVCLSEREKEDATVEAQKILSAVSRLNQRFGINYVIDFLRGSSTTKAEHLAIKTYGIGKNISKERWRQIVKELLQLQYLRQSDGEYPVLQLTDKSNAILRGELTVMLTKVVVLQKPAAEKYVTGETIHKELFTSLKAIRYQLAGEENVAAFQIFSDATLVELATYLPLTRTDLGKISGFGDIKIARYGDAFLDTIIDYCVLNNLSTKINSKVSNRQKLSNSNDKTTDTKKVSLQLFQLGRQPDEIAFERNLKRSTIEEHLAHFVFTGEVSLNEIVKADKIAAITKAIEANGNSWAMAPVKKILGDDFSYGEISAVMSYLRRMKEA
jgi:ATP-dependent DNA helicase RecQ